MNGRLYDPATGRFMSADPTIQYPDDMQNYNRYSYINNNPLAAVDYSGYGWNPFKKLKKLFKKLFKAVKSILRNKIVRLAATIAIATFAPEFIGSTNVFGGALKQYADVIAGGMSGLVSGRGDLRAAIQGAISAGAFGWAGDVGKAAGEYGVAHFAAHAVAGCASAIAGGGNCGQGALSAVAGKAGTWASDANMAVALVAGGTASVVSGGKFANGAVTSAFGYLYNFCKVNDCKGIDMGDGNYVSRLNFKHGFAFKQTMYLSEYDSQKQLDEAVSFATGSLDVASVIFPQLKLLQLYSVGSDVKTVYDVRNNGRLIDLLPIIGASVGKKLHGKVGGTSLGNQRYGAAVGYTLDGSINQACPPAPRQCN